MRAFVVLVIISLTCAFAHNTNVTDQNSTGADWLDWLYRFGHDDYEFPSWINEQIDRCRCDAIPITRVGDPIKILCNETLSTQQRRAMKEDDITFCVAKQWLVDRMPEFDKLYLPGSVSVRGTSMLDDNIAFALMTFRAANWASNLPRSAKLGYILPYASFHEARSNWRPLFFAKYFQVVAKEKSTVDAMRRLSEPGWSSKSVNNFANYSRYSWPDNDVSRLNYYMQWSSATSPPVLSPFDFIAYGYGSCTAHSTYLVYVARAVGIPARITGTPCWNSGRFRGLSTQNANVSICWQGGFRGASGGMWLNNHNWVEFWDDVKGRWVFLNSPPMGDLLPDTDLCSYDPVHGCDYDPIKGCNPESRPGSASRDHEIFAPTWLLPSDEEPGGKGPSGAVIAKDLRLSNGEKVSPLVWSSQLRSPAGVALADIGLRLVNRTEHYRCKP